MRDAQRGGLRRDRTGCGWRMILIPARNEGPRIGAVLEHVAVALPGVPVVVIVNGCTDDTEAVATQAGATVIHSEPGYGAALRAGYRYALGFDDVDWTVQLDADGQHPAAEIPRLLQALERADVVIGSRFVKGGGSPGWPRRRRWTIALLGLATSALTGVRLRDVSSGFQALRRPVLEVLAADFPSELMDANVLARLHKKGFSIDEVGVCMSARQGGESMHGGVKSALYAGKMMLAVLAEIRG